MPDLFVPKPSGELILRDYQEGAIVDLRAAYGRGLRAIILQLWTGAGKTPIAAFAIRSATQRGRRVLFVAHRRELLRQAAGKLDWVGVPYSFIAAGFPYDPDAQCFICSIQTLAAGGRIAKLKDIDLIVIDEAHHSVSATYERLLLALPQAKLLGLTATPVRLDGRGLGRHCGGHFDHIVCGPSMTELIEHGFLARARVLVPSGRIDVRGVHTVAGDFDEGELEERARGVTGDAVQEFAKLPANTTAIAFCVTVKHAESVAEAFRVAGVSSLCVHGEMPKPERDAAFAALADGSIRVLTSCEIVSEGVDIPSVGAVILLRPTQSLTMCLQQIGRGMRPKADGSPLVVLDHAGNCLVHGLPEEQREWSLDGLPKPEKKAKAPTWTCPACQTLNPIARRVCRECGYEREVVPRDVPIPDKAAMVQLELQKYAHILRLSYGQLLARPRSEAELHAYARHRGYKKGWVWHKMQEQAERFRQDGAS